MKKFILPLFILTTLPAFAVKINADTQLKWNAVVVVSAFKDIEFEKLFGNEEQYKLLYDLLERDIFSVSEAVGLCVSRCPNYVNEKDKTEWRETCKKLGYALIENNNKGTDAIYEGKGYYNAIGKIYTTDERYYVDYDANTVYVKHTHFNEDAEEISTEKCNESVFETKTNKKIAKCTSSSDDGFGGHTYFEGISPDYVGYEFEEYCHYYMKDSSTVCKLTITNEPGAGYRDFYFNYYKPCADALVGINFEEAKNIASSGVFAYQALDNLNALCEARNFIRDNSATETSYELYDDLYNTYEKYCYPLQFTLNKGVFKISEYINDMKKAFERAKTFFNDTTRYKNVQVSSLAEAQRRIQSDLNSVVRFVTGTIQCTGTCNKIPGTQDYVTCTLGSLKATFEFDDICNK